MNRPIIALVVSIALCAALATVGCSSAGTEAEDSAGQSQETVEETSASDPEDEETQTNSESEEESSGEEAQPVEIVEAEYYMDDDGYVCYAVCWYNPNETYAVERPTLNIVGYAKDGSIVFSETDTTSSLEPGETQYLTDWVGNGVEPATVEFTLETDPTYIAADEEYVERYEITNTSIVKGSYSTSITGAITTLVDSDDVTEAQVTVIFRDESGDFVYGEHGYVDVSSSEGGQTTFEISLWSKYDDYIPDYATYEAYALPR